MLPVHWLQKAKKLLCVWILVRYYCTFIFIILCLSRLCFWPTAYPRWHRSTLTVCPRYRRCSPYTHRGSWWIFLNCPLALCWNHYGLPRWSRGAIQSTRVDTHFWFRTFKSHGSAVTWSAGEHRKLFQSRHWRAGANYGSKGIPQCSTLSFCWLCLSSWGSAATTTKCGIWWKKFNFFRS